MNTTTPRSRLTEQFLTSAPCGVRWEARNGSIVQRSLTVMRFLGCSLMQARDVVAELEA